MITLASRGGDWWWCIFRLPVQEGVQGGVNNGYSCCSGGCCYGGDTGREFTVCISSCSGGRY